MNKDALINIIINDLKEVELLMEAFRGEQSVKAAFIDLAKRKVKSIEEELSLLGKEFGKGNGEEVRQEVKLETPAYREVSQAAVTVKETVGPRKEIVEEVRPEPVVVVEEKAVEEVKETVSVVEEAKPEPVVHEVVKQPEQPKPEQKQNDEHARLGDVLQKGKSALNEKMTRKSNDKDMKFAKPVTDVKKAFGINDRFLFQRELFGGNADLFNHTLDQINGMSSFEDARSFLMSNFDWDMESETADTFLNLVKRRFL